MGDCARLTESKLTRACGDIIPHIGVMPPQSPQAPILSPILSPHQTRQALQVFERHRHFFLDYVNLLFTVIDKETNKGIKTMFNNIILMTIGLLLILGGTMDAITGFQNGLYMPIALGATGLVIVFLPLIESSLEG